MPDIIASVPATSDLLVLALIVLVSVVVAGRAYFTWLRLSAMAADVRRRSERLEQSGEAGSPLDRARSRLVGANVALERQLWEVRRLDDRLAGMGDRLAVHRVSLDRLRTGRLVAAEDLLGQARKAWRVVKLAMRLRRSLPI